MASQQPDAHRILVLALAPVARVVRAVRRLERRDPRAEVVVGTTEVEAHLFSDEGLTVMALGEAEVELDRGVVADQIAAAGFTGAEIVVGFPLTPLMFVARWLHRAPIGGVVLRCGPLAVAGRRRARLAALLYSVLLYAPAHPMLRALAALDGALLLAAICAARLIRGRGAAAGRPAGTVCHVITNLRVGGAQKQVSSYLARTTVPGQKLLVLSQAPRPALIELEHRDVSAEVLSEDLLRTSSGRLALRYLPQTTALRRLRRRLEVLQPRVVVNWLFYANVVGATAGRLAGTPRILSSVRNLSVWKTWPENRRWWFRLADRLSAPLNDLVVGNARAVVDDYVAWSGVEPTRTAVIHNGIDPEAFADSPPRTEARWTLGLAPDEPVIVMVGRLAREKNYGYAVQVLAELKAVGACPLLLVVGDGPLEPELRKRAEALGVSERVRVVPANRDPRLLLRAADLLLLTSLIEGMPNVVLEAQLAGLPVVTTPCGGATEIVSDHVTGFVIPFDRADYAAASIRTLLEHPEVRERFSEAGREHVRRRFGVETMVQRLDAEVSR